MGGEVLFVWSDLSVSGEDVFVCLDLSMGLNDTCFFYCCIDFKINT